jgi:hypothetical protein
MIEGKFLPRPVGTWATEAAADFSAPAWPSERENFVEKPGAA